MNTNRFFKVMLLSACFIGASSSYAARYADDSRASQLLYPRMDTRTNSDTTIRVRNNRDNDNDRNDRRMRYDNRYDSDNDRDYSRHDRYDRDDRYDGRHHNEGLLPLMMLNQAIRHINRDRVRDDRRTMPRGQHCQIYIRGEVYDGYMNSQGRCIRY